MPLGGCGEIGKNMTLLAYGRNHILVDCGVRFPENDMHGFDLVLPQFDYLVKHQETLRGIVLTHGHMDHVGGLSHLLKHVSAPIYGTSLTIGIVRRLLSEANMLRQANLNIIDDRQQLKLGPFIINPFAVAHSIPGSLGLVIDTPVGAVVHTGDYKLDETPSGGSATDLRRLRELTPNGVLAMLGDSTNADREGRTPTEKLVTSSLERLFAEAGNSRIIIATFSSLLARLQEILYLANKFGRQVALTGRSLEQNIELACNLGVLDLPSGLLVDIKARVPDHKLVILSTGSQGEPRSALNRMASGQHRHVQIHDGDTIVISGGTIPGNEADVGRMLDNLFALGANVVYGSLACVHVSGHGSREDMRTMLQTVQPRFLIPVHGEQRHLHLHARLAQECGISATDVYVLANGSCWTTDGRSAALGAPIPAGDVYVDGKLTGNVDDGLLDERGHLATSGVVVVNVPVDQQKRLAGRPSITSHGFMPQESAQPLLNAAQSRLSKRFKRGREIQKNLILQTLEAFLFAETRSRPLILASFVNVK